MTAQEDENCGGYLERPAIGFLFSAPNGWLERTQVMELCSLGTAMNGRVVEGAWERDFADASWDRLLLRLGMCENNNVRQAARRWLASLSGEPVFVALQYCSDTWDYRDRTVKLEVLSDRTAWFRKEVFCEMASNTFGPTGPGMKNLDSISEHLCGEVRAGLDVDDAFNRWLREFVGGPGSFVAFLIAAIKWTVSGVLQFVVTLVAVLGGLVGIAVGLKKLLGALPKHSM